ncbi:hypothetical protein BKA70DRAFT_1445673 [Coprinopsis sp. MPI-PUGE-AT-0042]|nr:hypothetical protein BKA70DRAFT_1445673 [Coprinopsis sp. MPI-PUGE-AT-0042]
MPATRSKSSAQDSSSSALLMPKARKPPRNKRRAAISGEAGLDGIAPDDGSEGEDAPSSMGRGSMSPSKGNTNALDLQLPMPIVLPFLGELGLNIPIDPVLLRETPQSSENGATSTEQEGSERSMGTSEPPIYNIVPEKAKHRPQPSGVNPIHGLVQGAGCGREPYAIACGRKLKDPILDQALATKSFDRWTQDLVTRCESISSRTKCWLYLAVQHPQSKTPFVHFTSSKLLKEAPEEVSKIHTEASKMMSTLTRGYRLSAVEAERGRLRAEEQAEEALNRARKAEDELDRL